jgi:hypothetical protein|uniref:Prolyl 4-hydroxylase alpha subunit Fe(2+) 2OG dioxygenase domain-containing protein n=1 Tax=viral metagenome TaxID=1070528 RepID=A0A6C0E6M9_9ZZZZ
MSTLEEVNNGTWFNRDMVKEESVILNKALLTDTQLEYLLQKWDEIVKIDNVIDNRIVGNIDIPPDFIKDWCMKLEQYILINKIYPVGGIKKYKYGGIKEHSDALYYDSELDINSTYTLLIYLSDDEGGETAIKRKKYRVIDDDANMKHERIYVKPRKGYCVLFNSKLKHFANDSYDGKLILHTRIY